MAKVIMLARNFLKKHPKTAQPTYFVEKVLNSLNISYRGNDVPLIGANSSALEDNRFSTELLAIFRKTLDPLCADEKHHTMRAGKRWKTGDKASLRIWSGDPYDSPQITIAPDVEITVKDVEICDKGQIYIDGKEYLHIVEAIELAKNDGLSPADFLLWIGYPFSGQLLIWNNNDLPY